VKPDVQLVNVIGVWAMRLMLVAGFIAALLLGPAAWGLRPV